MVEEILNLLTQNWDKLFGGFRICVKLLDQDASEPVATGSESGFQRRCYDEQIFLVSILISTRTRCKKVKLLSYPGDLRTYPTKKFGRIQLSRKMQYIENSIYNMPKTLGRIFRRIVDRNLKPETYHWKCNTSNRHYCRVCKFIHRIFTSNLISWAVWKKHIFQPFKTSYRAFHMTLWYQTSKKGLPNELNLTSPYKSVQMSHSTLS